MKFNRPIAPASRIPPAVIGAQPQPSELAYYQTPPTPEVDWRQELARVAVVAGVAGGIGLFASVTAIIIWPTWTTVAIGGWFSILLAIFPFGVHAVRISIDIRERHRLDRARMNAEHKALVGALDTDQSGKVDDAEVQAFIDYVRAIHRGAPTTASYAQAKHGIPGSAWQSYRNWLIKNGYALPVARRGGEGFVLKPSVRRTPWPRIENALRQHLLAGLGAPDEDLRIIDAGGPIDAVSSLGRN